MSIVHNELGHLVENLLNSSVSPEDFAKLENLLRHDDAARRRYADLLRLHLYMERQSRQASQPLIPARHRHPWGLRAAAGLLVAITLALFAPRRAPALEGWTVTAQPGALWEILDKGSLRLDIGELLVASTPGKTPAPLTILTPEATTTARGTRFHISHHTQGDATMKSPATFRNLTRVLVLSGSVILGNSLGSVSANEGELVATTSESFPRKIVLGQSSFAYDLYRKLAEADPKRNLVFSPFSISQALAMTAEGARGVTAQEMGDVLHFPFEARRTGEDAQKLPWETMKIHSGISGLNNALRKGGKLRIANCLFGERSLAFNQDAINSLADAYQTPGLILTDFINHPEDARRMINIWGAEQTLGMIKEILPADSITADTRLALASAVHFKADWMHPFDANRTTKQPFHCADGSDHPVEMMQLQREWLYGDLPISKDKGPRFQMLELPYAGGELSMLVLLPAQTADLGALEAALSSEQVASWRAGCHPRPVKVEIPKFSMLSDSIRLQQPLAALGMQEAFDDKADFSGFVSATLERLSIDEIHHRASIEVHESGSEASALTTVTIKSLSDPYVFRADRPFIYLIRESLTGSVLFMGRMMDPKMS